MNISQVIRLDSERSNTLVCTHSYAWRLILHAFNYTVVTYGYFSLRRWDKNHCTQDELAILMMHKFLKQARVAEGRAHLVS